MRALVIVIAVLWTTSACHLLQPASEISDQRSSAGNPDLSELNPQQFELEIKKLEKEVADTPAKEENQEVHLRLAYLYMSGVNPERNYPMALQHLNAYLLIAGDAGRRPDLELLHSLLNELATLEHHQEMCDQEITQTQNRLDDLEHHRRMLNEQLRQSRAANNRLARENTKLRRTLEILQTIDRNLEEKRKSYR